MRIIVPTIQHTGTWFMAYHLLERFLANGKDSTHYNTPGNGVVLHHVYEGKMDGLRRELETNKGISPLRHPAAVWASWQRRGRPLEHLFEQTANLISLQCPNLVFLPIDHPDRGAYLKAASDHIGHELSTDWPRIHEHDGSIVGECGDASFDDYMAQFGRFWSNWYLL